MQPDVSHSPRADAAAPAAQRAPVGRWLGFGLLVLAALLATNAVLGPLATGTIEYRFSQVLINQGIGLDAVALFLAAPVAVLAAILTLAGHRAGSVVAFIPATFAAYMAPQYLIGPDYLAIPGNNERFFVLHLLLFVVAVGVACLAWHRVDRTWLPPASRAADRRRSWVMFAVAAFILLGRWLPAIVALTLGKPTIPEYLENPTSYLLIGLLDVGLVVPAAITAGVGLRRGALWSRTAAYAVIGWFALVPAAVASMAITMQINDDPAASVGATFGFTVAAVVFTAGALALYRPLFHEGTPNPQDPPEPGPTAGTDREGLRA